MLLLLLVGTIVWRINTSLPQANSRNRPDDHALDRAAILLGAPLPQNASLFAAVEDTLAIQYLTQIWEVRPDLKILSSPAVSALLGAGTTVYVTYQSAERLYSELPETGDIKIGAVNPDWVQLSTQEAPSPPDSSIPDIVLDGQREWAVTLGGYRVTTGPTGLPVRALGGSNLDIMLYWALPHEEWPEGVSISVRPMSGGALIPDPAGEAGAILQQDASQPLHGLLSLSGESITKLDLIVDAYRIEMPIEAISAVDEIQVLLYRSVDGGFETVAEYRLEELP